MMRARFFFNPALMTGLDGRQINIGVNLLIPDANLSDTGSGGLSAGGSSAP